MVSPAAQMHPSSESLQTLPSEKKGFLRRYLGVAIATPITTGGAVGSVVYFGGAVLSPIAGIAAAGGFLLPMAGRKLHCLFKQHILRQPVPPERALLDEEEAYIQGFEDRITRLEYKVQAYQKLRLYDSFKIWHESLPFAKEDFHALDLFQKELQNFTESFRKWVGIQEVASEEGLVLVGEEEDPLTLEIGPSSDPVLQRLSSIEQRTLSLEKTYALLQKQDPSFLELTDLFIIFEKDVKMRYRSEIKEAQEALLHVEEHRICAFLSSTFRVALEQWNLELHTWNWEEIQGKAYNALFCKWTSLFETYKGDLNHPLEKTSLVQLKKFPQLGTEDLPELTREWSCVSSDAFNPPPGPNASEMKKEGPLYCKLLVSSSQMPIILALLKKLEQDTDFKTCLFHYIHHYKPKIVLACIAEELEKMRSDLKQLDYPSFKKPEPSRKRGKDLPIPIEGRGEFQKEGLRNSPKKVHFSNSSPKIRRIDPNVLRCENFRIWTVRQGLIESFDPKIKHLKNTLTELLNETKTSLPIVRDLQLEISAFEIQMRSSLSLLDMISIFKQMLRTEYFTGPFLLQKEAAHFVSSIFGDVLEESTHETDFFPKFIEALEKYKNDKDAPLENSQLVEVDFIKFQEEFPTLQNWTPLRDAKLELNLQEEHFKGLGGEKGADLAVRVFVDELRMKSLIRLLNELKENLDFQACLQQFFKDRRLENFAAYLVRNLLIEIGKQVIVTKRGVT